MRFMWFGACVAASIAVPAIAGEVPLYAPPPSWVIAAPPLVVEKRDGVPAFLQFDNQVRLSKNERVVYIESAFKIASAEMLNSVGTVNLPWMPDKGDLTIHAVQIIRGKDVIDVLAGPSKFSVLRREQQLEQMQINGMLTASLSVPGLRVGDTLRLGYSVSTNEPLLRGNSEVGGSLIALPVRVNYGRLRTVWTDDVAVKWRAYGDGIAPTLTKAGGLNELTIMLPVAKPADLPQDAPARYLHGPFFEASSFASWSDVSKAMAPLYDVSAPVAADSPIAADIARIRKAESDPLKQAAMTLRIVQDDIRYLFVGLNNGNFTPQPAEQTVALKYGDCKAKTLLLLTLLHGLGIEAEPVLASTAAGDWLPERLPAVGVFDHILVRATIAGNSYWLDGTQTGTRLQDIADVPALHSVLPVRKAGSALLPLQARPNARPAIQSELTLDQSAGINFYPVFSIVYTLHGSIVEKIRGFMAQAGSDEIITTVQNFLETEVNGGIVTSRAITFDDEAGTAVITASGIGYVPWIQKDGRRRAELDRLLSDFKFEPDRARSAWKDIPVRIDDNGGVKRTVRLKLPNGGKGFTLQGDMKLAGVIAGREMSRSAVVDNGIVIVSDQMFRKAAELSGQGIVDAKSQVALAKSRLLGAIAPNDTKMSAYDVLDDGSDLRFAAQLAAYNQAIVEQPDKFEPYRNRATFTAGIYRHQQAIADLDKVIELAPDSASYLWRAQLLAETGKWKQAIADAEMARSLETDGDIAYVSLVNLLQSTGDFSGALKLLDEKIAAGGNNLGFLRAQRASMLADMGQIAEALAEANRATAASPTDGAVLNLVCWMRGQHNVELDRALADCTKAIELLDEPAQAYDSRALIAYRQGRFADAIVDLDAALKLDDDSASSLYMRALNLMRLGRTQEARKDLAAARLVNPQVAVDYDRYGIKP